MPPNTNIAQIPFKVSARTARLIGRENIATPKGAIIELVKNSYDADSSICLVYFDNKYSSFQKEISKEYFNVLLNKGVAIEILLENYRKQGDSYVIKKESEYTSINKMEESQGNLKRTIANLTILYIIDFGEGMTQSIIRNNWMTIGTDNKAENFRTKSGRIKAGAKGIGRFALDKLGSKCEMITVFDKQRHDPDIDGNKHPTNFTAYNWKVNWEDFEGRFKTIDTINAQLMRN